MSRDEEMMRRALELALNGWGKTSPNPMVGAVIVKEGVVLAEGWHDHCGGPHAEVVALEQARARGLDVRGATMYVNLEPCSHYGRTPPCSLALVQSGIRRVVTSMVDPNPLVAGRGHSQLRQAGIEVVSGVLEEEARRLNDVFIHFITHRRPFVCLKLAASLDGKTAAVGGRSRWISGPEARSWVHRQRQRYRAVCVGIGTALADDPLLTARDATDQPFDRQPLRIVIDPRLEIPTTSRLVQTAARWPVLIVCAQRVDPEKVRILSSHGVEVFPCSAGPEGLDLDPLLEDLYAREIDSILLEGGSRTAGHFLDRRWIDKIAFVYAPLLLGGGAAPGLIAGVGRPAPDHAVRLSRPTITPLGQDFLVEAYVEE